MQGCSPINCLWLVPQTSNSIITDLNAYPISVSSYSTRGGTSARTVLLITLFASSLRSCKVNILSVIPSSLCFSSPNLSLPLSNREQIINVHCPPMIFAAYASEHSSLSASLFEELVYSLLTLFIVPNN